ncbi:peptide chain release factor N(5)-glutamine methyltransferase [uncultured Marinobacter sp.]|uniref:peptide chain release factor N(5)-glutamine methyltransferase n=1 Tax=uncultured Marinobacter sp. TaxID=187379 RepID=UPI002606C221|nr:peptide chain release factor N(5)-glutamine methyltransferase [uncultured Marinobacter sp.]
MSESSLTCDALLRKGTITIAGESPRLDAELLLSYVTGLSRTSFRAWPERQVTASEAKRFEALVQQRASGHPVAHLLGEQEFWSLPLKVNVSTLIPRPDTECLVEAALGLPLPDNARVLDLGTGTGAIALALASERRGWRVLACDAVASAVELASENARRLDLPVTMVLSHWFDNLPAGRFDLIVSNPPYIASGDHHLGEGDVRFEPASALVAGEDGLDDIRTIVASSTEWLNAGGWLMVEHGFDQGDAVRELFLQAGLVVVETRRDYGDRDRLTLGQWPG